MKCVNFSSGPKIGKCGFSGEFLVKTWKDICYPIGRLAGKVEDCSISWDETYDIYGSPDCNGLREHDLHLN